MNEVNTSRAGLIRAKSLDCANTPIVTRSKKDSHELISIVSVEPLSEIIFSNVSGGELSGSGIKSLSLGQYKWVKEKSSSLCESELDSNISHFNKIEDEIELNGNAWKTRSFKYTITKDTILELEFKSTLEPEASMIVFDSDNLFDTKTFNLQFYGAEEIAKNMDALFKPYDGSGEWVKYSIKIGASLAGLFTRLAFVNDGLGNSSFRNVIVYESKPKFDLTFLFTPVSDLINDVFADVIVKTNVNETINCYDPQEIQLYENSVSDPLLKKETEAGSEVDEFRESSSTLHTNGVLQRVDSVSISELEVVLNGDVDPQEMASTDLFSMLTFIKNAAGSTGSPVLAWSFNASTESFSCLSKNESIVLIYNVETLNDSSFIGGLNTHDIVITILGTNAEPIVSNFSDKVSEASSSFEYMLNKPSDGLNLTVENLTYSLSGPANEEVSYSLEESGLFSLDPSQFHYLKVGEQLKLVFIYDLVEDSCEKNRRTKTLTLLVDGKKEVLEIRDFSIEVENSFISGGSLNKIESISNSFETPEAEVAIIDEVEGLNIQGSEKVEDNEEGGLNTSYDSSHESMTELVNYKKEKDFRIITQYNLDEKINLGESLVGEFDCFNTPGES